MRQPRVLEPGDILDRYGSMWIGMWLGWVLRMHVCVGALAEWVALCVGGWVVGYCWVGGWLLLVVVGMFS